MIIIIVFVSILILIVFILIRVLLHRQHSKLVRIRPFRRRSIWGRVMMIGCVDDIDLGGLVL